MLFTHDILVTRQSFGGFRKDQGGKVDPYPDVQISHTHTEGHNCCQRWQFIFLFQTSFLLFSGKPCCSFSLNNEFMIPSSAIYQDANIQCMNMQLVALTWCVRCSPGHYYLMIWTVCTQCLYTLVLMGCVLSPSDSWEGGLPERRVGAAQHRPQPRSDV